MCAQLQAAWNGLRISFLVLALFWLGHHRLFNIVRHVDGKLLALNLVQLGFARPPLRERKE